MTKSKNLKIKSKAPLIVIITSWLLTIGSIYFLLAYVIQPLYLMGNRTFASYGLAGAFGSLAIYFNTAISIGGIMVASGLRHMRKSSLYIFSVLTIIAVVGSDFIYLLLTHKYTTNRLDFIHFILAIQALIMIYFWTIFKKFK